MPTKFKEVIEIKGDLSDIKKKLKQLNGKLDKIGTDGKGATDKIGKGFTALKATIAGAMLTAVFAFKGLITSAKELQTEMTNVRTLAKWNNTEFRIMTETVQELSRSMPNSAQELAAGLYQVVSASVPANKQLKVLEASARAGTAGIASTTDALNLGGAVIKAYGKDWSEFTKIQDNAFKTVELGQTTFSELSVGIQEVAATGSALKIKNEELFGSFATLTGVTGNTAKVATQLKGILMGLIKPKDQLIKLIKDETGLTVQDMVAKEGLVSLIKFIKEATNGEASAVGELFESREALNALLALTGDQYDVLIDKTDQITKSQGAMNDAFILQKATLNNQIKIFKNQLTPALVGITTGFTNALTSVNDFLQGLTENALETSIRKMKELGVETLEWELEMAKVNEVMAQTKAYGLDQEKIMGEINKELWIQKDLGKDLADQSLILKKFGFDDMTLQGRISDIISDQKLTLQEKIDKQKEAMGLWAVLSKDFKRAENAFNNYDESVIESLKEQLALIDLSNLSTKQREALENAVLEIKTEQVGLTAKELQIIEDEKIALKEKLKSEKEIADQKKKADDEAKIAKDGRIDAEKQLAGYLADSAAATLDAGLSGQNMLKILGDSAKQLLIMIFRQKIYNALLKATSLGSGGATGVLGYLASVFGGFHQGGLVKMHSGGLMPNETLSVLKQGEFVIRNEAVKNIGIGNLARMNQTGQVPQDFSRLENQMVLMNKNLKRLDRQVNITSEIDGVEFVRETVEPSRRRIANRTW